MSAGTAGELSRARRQNEKFFVSVTLRRPFVLAKWASSLDGKIASASGESRWISGKAARRRAMLLREELDALAKSFDSERALGLFAAVDRAQSALDRNVSPKVVADWLALQV